MAVGVAALALLLAVSLVGAETYREYDSWENRDNGVLDVWFGIVNHDLEAMPEWSCVKNNPPRLVDGVLHVQSYTLGDDTSPYTNEQWERYLSERMGFPVLIEPIGVIPTVQEAKTMAEASPGAVHLVFKDEYFRGPNLNEKVEGVACGSLAVVNAHANCPEGVAAHEIGHVLGLAHTHDGLMRARAAACPEILSESQIESILAKSLKAVQPAAPTLIIEEGEKEGAGKGEEKTEPSAESPEA